MEAQRPPEGAPAEQAAAASLRIFINYRRDDAADLARRLYDTLVARFGENHVLMDIDAIEPGVDFEEAVNEAVGSWDVCIAVIGRQWLTTADAKGRRRLDNPDDFVRLELQAALERNVRVIPVLVQGVGMPGSDELPDQLKKLARRNAVEISTARWTDDVGRLMAALEKIARAAADQAAERERAAAAERERADRERAARERAQREDEQPTSVPPPATGSPAWQPPPPPPGSIPSPSPLPSPSSFAPSVSRESDAQKPGPWPWALMPVLSLGFLSSVPFFYMGARARYRPWVLLGIGYLALTFVMIALVAVGNGRHSTASGFGGGLVLLLMACGCVNVLLLRKPFGNRLAAVETPALRAAEQRALVRSQAQAIVRNDPARAIDLGIGRPDLPNAFDAGLVDVNHAPPHVLTSGLGLDEETAAAIVEARGSSGFSSVEDLDLHLDLPPEVLSRLRQTAIFLLSP